jgi:anti-anti-sigma regulatory factor
MGIALRKDGDVHIVTFSGSIRDAKKLTQMLDLIFQDGGFRVVIDCSTMMFISPQAITALIKMKNILPSIGGINLVGLLPGPRQAFIDLGILSQFEPIYNSVDDARAGFSM